MASGMADKMACYVFSARDDEGGLYCGCFSFSFQTRWRPQKSEYDFKSVTKAYSPRLKDPPLVINHVSASR